MGKFVNIRVYREDRDRLAANMKYGDTMADMIHRLLTVHMSDGSYDTRGIPPQQP